MGTWSKERAGRIAVHACASAEKQGFEQRWNGYWFCLCSGPGLLPAAAESLDSTGGTGTSRDTILRRRPGLDAVPPRYGQGWPRFLGRRMGWQGVQEGGRNLELSA